MPHEGETAINQSITMDLPDSLPAQPRAIGSAMVRVRGMAGGVTRIADLRQAGSLKLVFPRSFRPAAEAILVNTAGGITGGDRFSIAADLGPGSHLAITTQAAERAYRAQPGETGRIDTRLTVAEGARLDWLPQELILFDRAALRRSLDITLAPTARLLLVEPVVFGRAAMSEVLQDIRFHDRIRVWRDGRPLYADGMILKGDASAHLQSAAVAAGAGAMASLVYVAPDAAAQLGAVRALLPETAGASLLAPDTLVLRQLAPDSLALRRHLIPVLDRLTGNTLPTSWRL